MTQTGRAVLTTVLGIALAVGTTQAAPILVNFGGVGGTNASFPGGGDDALTFGGTWNDMPTLDSTDDEYDAMLAPGSVLYSDGTTAAGVSIVAATFGDGVGAGTSDEATGHTDGQRGWIDIDVIDQGFRHRADDNLGPATITIAGLNQALSYDIELVASNAGRGARAGDYSIFGDFGQKIEPDDTTTANGGDDFNERFDGYLDGAVLVWSATPNGAGEIVLTIDGHNANAVASAMMINAVPEPATMSLLALGGLALLKRRR